MSTQSTPTTSPKTSLMLPFEIKECLEDIIQSYKFNNYILCRNALKNFEHMICPELGSWKILQILTYDNSNNSSSNKSEHVPLAMFPSSSLSSLTLSSSSFSSILLEMISNRNDNGNGNDENLVTVLVPESCRERASNCLLALIQNLKFVTRTRSSMAKEAEAGAEGSRNGVNHDADAAKSVSGELDHEEMQIQNLLCRLFQKYCPIFARRFAPSSKETRKKNNENSNKSSGHNNNKALEEAEEIRFILVQIMSALIEALRACSCSSDCTRMTKKKSNVNTTSSSDTMAMSIGMTGASNILLQSLAKCALLDPYPDLQRESCKLLMQMCQCHAYAFPTVISLGAELLLRSLVGSSVEIVESPLLNFHTDTSRSMEESRMMSFLTIDDDDAEGDASNEVSDPDGLLKQQQQNVNVLSSLSMPMPGSGSNTFNSKDSLLHHRHAKTRILALEALAEVMRCFSANSNASESVPVSSPRGDNDGDDDRSKSDDNVNNANATHHSDDAEVQLRVQNNGNPSKVWGDTFVNKLMSQVLPNLETVAPYDKSASVRIALVKTVSDLLCLTFQFQFYNLPLEGDVSNEATRSAIRTRTTAMSRLIVLFIMGLSDDSDKIATNAALLCMDKVVPHMSQWLGKDYGFGCGFSKNDDAVRSLLVPFAREIVDMLLANIAGIIAVDHKQRHLDSLAFVVSRLISAQGCTEYGSLWEYSRVMKVIIVLCKSFSSDEKEIFRSAMKCANALGGNVDSRGVALTIVLSSIRGDIASGGNNIGDKIEMSARTSIIISSPNQCAAALYFLSGLLRGGSSQAETETPAKGISGAFESSLVEISSTMVHERLLQYLHVSPRQFAYSLLDICGAVIDLIISSGQSCDGNYVAGNSAIQDTLLCCIYLLSCGVTKAGAMRLLDSFAQGLTGVKDVSQLLDIYFDDLFELITKELHEPTGAVWEFGDINVKAFDSLLRTCHGETIGHKMGKIGPILESHLSGEAISSLTTAPSSESKEDVQLIFQTKLFIMALVQSIVSNPDLPKKYVQPFAEALLTNAVIPNLVWQVGSHASALRKLSAAVLLSILQGGTSTLTICKLCPELLPILKSTLGDDDGIIRELVSVSLSKIFEALPAVLGEQAIDKLYPELMRGLDDGNENVRFASCDALRNFLRCAPAANYRGTAIEYMVENLFVHLDDPNPGLQEKVYAALVAAVSVDPAVVAKNAEASIFSHRHSKYCKKLLNLACDK